MSVKSISPLEVHNTHQKKGTLPNIFEINKVTPGWLCERLDRQTHREKIAPGSAQYTLQHALCQHFVIHRVIPDHNVKLLDRFLGLTHLICTKSSWVHASLFSPFNVMRERERVKAFAPGSAQYSIECILPNILSSIWWHQIDYVKFLDRFSVWLTWHVQDHHVCTKLSWVHSVLCETDIKRETRKQSSPWKCTIRIPKYTLRNIVWSTRWHQIVYVKLLDRCLVWHIWHLQGHHGRKTEILPICVCSIRCFPWSCNGASSTVWMQNSLSEGEAILPSLAWTITRPGHTTSSSSEFLTKYFPSKPLILDKLKENGGIWWSNSNLHHLHISKWMWPRLMWDNVDTDSSGLNFFSVLTQHLVDDSSTLIQLLLQTTRPCNPNSDRHWFNPVVWCDCINVKNGVNIWI